MKILIVEDHAIVRAGLKALLQQQSGWTIVGEVDRAEGIRDAVDRFAPDVVVLDYALPDGDTFAIASWLAQRNEGLRLVVLTGIESPVIIQRLAASRIDGILHKMGEITELVAAIEAVSRGERYLSSEIRELVAQADVELTDRELQTLSLIVQGLGRSEIAERLHISVETVKSHRRRLVEKLGVSTTAALVDRARALGLSDASS